MDSLMIPNVTSSSKLRFIDFNAKGWIYQFVGLVGLIASLLPFAVNVAKNVLTRYSYFSALLEKKDFMSDIVLHDTVCTCYGCSVENTSCMCALERSTN